MLVRLAAAVVATLALAPRTAPAQLLGGHEFQVNANTAGNQNYPTVVADGAGNSAIIWRDGAYDCYGRRYDGSGATIGSPVLLSSTYFPYCGNGDGAADAAGNIVLVRDGVFAQRFDSTLTTIGGEFQVGAAHVPYSMQYDVGPEVAVRPTGEFVVVWRTHPTGALKGQSYDASATPLGPVFDIASGNSQLEVAYDNTTGNFLVGWDDFNFDRMGRGFDPTGTPLGPAFAMPLPAGRLMTAGAPGEFVVAAVDINAGLRARRIDIAGNVLGPDLLVANYSSTMTLHRPTRDGAGNLLFTWTEHTDANGDDLVGRLFDATGSPQGSAFPINIYRAGDQFLTGDQFGSLDPTGGAATGTAGTGFVVAWTSRLLTGRPQDGDGAGVFARRLDDTAGIDGRRLLVKDGTAPTSRRIVLRAGDAVISTGSGAGMNPVADGAFLHVYGAGGSNDSACMPLPASGWVASGDPEHPRYDYKDAAFANGPCNRVRVKHGGMLQVSCRASVQPIAYSLDEASQGSVAVRFASGGLAYCMTFGGNVSRDVQGSAFVATKAPAPVACAVPPASCP